MPPRTAAALALVLAFHPALPAQSQGSIQGVWRPVSRSIPATTNPGDRSDPFAHVPVGTQTNLQPGLMIFTAKHYSRTTDTATIPRPTTQEAKDPAGQRGTFARLTVKMDGDRGWLTPVENAAGRIVAGVTTEYVRVE